MKKGTILYGAVCFALGAAVCGGSAAYAAGVLAEKSSHTVYVGDEQAELGAYLIDGVNYVKLRDVGEAVGFNVYWDEEDRAVRIEPDKPYTGVAPESDGLDENMDVRLEIVRLANEERAKVGAPALAVNDALMDAAQKCAEQCFTAHEPEFECKTALACGYPHGFGSNLTVFGGASQEYIASHAVRNWVNSKPHYESMIDSCGRDIGVGVNVVDGKAYCYMLIGDPDAYNFFG